MTYGNYYLDSFDSTIQSIHCSIIRPKEDYMKNTSKEHELKVYEAINKMCGITDETLKKEVQRDN